MRTSTTPPDYPATRYSVHFTHCVVCGEKIDARRKRNVPWTKTCSQVCGYQNHLAVARAAGRRRRARAKEILAARKAKGKAAPHKFE